MRGARPERALERDIARRVAASREKRWSPPCPGGRIAWRWPRCWPPRGACRREVVLAHVNHRTRAAGYQDEAVVLAVGAALQARVVAASLPEGSASEARLREERYALLREIAVTSARAASLPRTTRRIKPKPCSWRFFAGRGRRRCAACPARRPLGEECVLERPLLRVRREELTAYCARRASPWRSTRAITMDAIVATLCAPLWRGCANLSRIWRSRRALRGDSDGGGGRKPNALVASRLRERLREETPEGDAC